MLENAVAGRPTDVCPACWYNAHAMCIGCTCLVCADVEIEGQS